MRRGSLVGPFILIGLGAVLLVNNLRPELSLLELAASYWPFLLVGWGVLRVAELLASSTKGQPLPRAGITGGEWALVVLICLIGSGTHFARANWPNARITMHGLEVFGEAYDFPVSGRHATGESPRVIVENLNGNIRVIGGDAAEVTVEGRTTVRAFDREGAQKSSDKCPLEIVEQGGQIIIRTNHDRSGGASKISTDLDIVVPKGSSVEGRGRYGDFDVANVTGDVEINSDNAGVRLTEIGGSARIELRRSDIIRIVGLQGTADISGRGEDVELENIQGVVTIDGSYSGELIMRQLAQQLIFNSKRTELRIAQTPGRIRMALGDFTADNIVGPIVLKTSSRDVNLSNFTEDIELEIDRGDVQLRPGAGAIAGIGVSLKSGDITLSLPKSATFGLEAETSSGEAINESGAALTLETVGKRGARMTGPSGVKTNVRLKTKRGRIVVRETTGTAKPEPKRLESTSA